MALHLNSNDCLLNVSMHFDVIPSVGKSDEWIETVASGEPMHSLG